MDTTDGEHRAAAAETRARGGEGGENGGSVTAGGSSGSPQKDAKAGSNRLRKKKGRKTAGASGKPAAGGFGGGKAKGAGKGVGASRGKKGSGGAKGRARGGAKKESPAAREARRKKIMARSKPLRLSTSDMDPNEFVLSRFIVNPWGQQLGESIGVEGRNLIMKKGLKFYSIPIKFIRESGPDLVLTKRVDWAKSLALGERWRKRTLELPSPKPLFEKSRELEKGDGQEGAGGKQAEGQKPGRTVKVASRGGDFRAPPPPRKGPAASRKDKGAGPGKKA